MTADLQPPQVLTDRFPITLPIDGRDIRFWIKRFDLGEYTAFIRDFNRVGRMGSRDQYRIERARQPILDPVTRTPARRDAGDVLMETDDQVLARLDFEETAEQRATREQRDAEEEAFATEFLVRSLTEYVTCEAGQLSTAREPVTTGAQILQAYGARQDVLQQLLQAIFSENCLPEAIKKKLASRPGSQPGSPASTPTAPGGGPDPIAAPAGERGSANPAAAMAWPGTSSGSAGTTS